MRLSVYPDDPGYHPLAAYCTVYLGGEIVTACVTADEELGECICFDLDADTEGLSEVPTIVRRGKVQIVLGEEWSCETILP